MCTSLNECGATGFPTPPSSGRATSSTWTSPSTSTGTTATPRGRICVGKVTDEVQRLVDVTEKSLAEAIKICKPGTPVRKIGATIHAIADEAGLWRRGEVRRHGVGKEFQWSHGAAPQEQRPGCAGEGSGRSRSSRCSRSGGRRTGCQRRRCSGRQVDGAVRAHACSITDDGSRSSPRRP